MKHQEIERKIQFSNTDRVDELGASLPLDVPQLVSEYSGYTFSSPNPEQEKLRAEEAARAKPKGYQPMEYTSMYDTQGGYKPEEYKSMYD
jgi:hypothetical protein